ncbi:uncharacterized protein YndB with AHSA1/START domain [Crossiella equi]|uniref:Uncharacterized protein YndB with AHSA1/START domain n=1 Tax=Crossiella equi TaxID=130796 RepID=A0ABS5A533_9PSEU|nr:SRPBCC domain-containing protein [Crossiella equi]MBP2471694.1 uncharacterized protein YndB with AHSA1/START domain [Crossiella equi]
MGRDFTLSHEVELQATPQEVWDAVTTATGNEAWFMTIPDTQAEQAEVFQPPHHLKVRLPADQDGSTQAFEYLIEAKDGGSTVLRFVHSGFLSDSWGSEYEAMTQRGWEMYLHTLALYFKHFHGRRGRYITAEGPVASASAEAWPVLLNALGLDRDPELGEQVKLSPDGLKPIEGVVDWVEPGGQFLAVRGENALYRFHGRAPLGLPIAVGHHAFSSAIDSACQEGLNKAWGEWLHQVYAGQG